MCSSHRRITGETQTATGQLSSQKRVHARFIERGSPLGKGSEAGNAQFRANYIMTETSEATSLNETNVTSAIYRNFHLQS